MIGRRYMVVLEQLGRQIALHQLVRLGDGKVIREVSVRATSTMSRAVIWARRTLTRAPGESREAFAQSSCTVADPLVGAFLFDFVSADMRLFVNFVAHLGPGSGTRASA